MKRRVLRGGWFISPDSRNLRPTDRSRGEPGFRHRYIGFRVVLVRRKP